MKDRLGDHMKAHENVTRVLLPRQTYTIIRVDGRAFHTYAKNLGRPYDLDLMWAMNEVAQALCAEVAGAVFAYTQSDEVSVLVTDFATPQTQPWLGGVVQKMASVTASVATLAFRDARQVVAGDDRFAHFDSRVFTLPSRSQVEDYFLWRHADAVRNSISLTARSFFSHRELDGVTGNQMQEMLWQQHGVNWNDMPDGFKRGRLTQKIQRLEPAVYVDGRTGKTVSTDAWRNHWVTEPAPRLRKLTGTLLDLIPARDGAPMAA